MKFIYACILLLLSFSQLFAGAWTQKKGSGYYQLSFQHLSSDAYYNSNGTKVEGLATLTDTEISFYGEYGITDDVTVVGYLPFKFLRGESDAVFIDSPPPVLGESELSGLGDIDLGIRFKIAQLGQTFLSTSLKIGIPTGKDEIENSLLLGDGEFNQTISFNLGHSLYPLPAFISFSVGYNNRNEGYSDQIISGFEGGYSFFDSKLLVMLKLRALFSMSNGDDRDKGGLNKLFADNQQYLAVSPEVVYKVSEQIGVNASITTGGLTENIISAVIFRVGLYYKM